MMDADRLFSCPVCEKGVPWSDLNSHYTAHFELYEKGIKTLVAQTSSVELATLNSTELQKETSYDEAGSSCITEENGQ